MHLESERQYKNHPKQRGSLHVWCQMIADQCNAAGLTKQVILAQRPNVEWSGTAIKEDIYKPILKAISGLESTEAQITTDPQVVVNEMARFFAEKFGVILPEWPSRK